MTRQQAEEILYSTFKIPHFYDDQWYTIQKVLSGEKVLLIEKTGFGKSLCFQFPAVVFEGMAVVFSPLIALMRDQVKKLAGLGIAARCINSGQTPEENGAILDEAKVGEVKILYIAPERQENEAWLEAVRQMKLSMVVIDEAHCVSVWGHDFRPAFKRIADLVQLLPKGTPVLATTATATREVEQDIIRQIGSGIRAVRGSLMRPNLKLFVIKVASEDEKYLWLGKNLSKMPGCGLLYTGTRVNTELYSQWFDFLGIPCMGYNGKLDSETRIEIENGLLENRWKCVVSTNALGMGMDKPDIRFVIHTQIPQSLIHYYQEIGRAGRDGQTSYIILFYGPNDRELPEAFIEGGRPPLQKYELVLKAIRSELLGEHELMKKTNLRQTPFRVIKADLIEQKIIREVLIGKSKKYEYIPGAPALETATFEALRVARLAELQKMLDYLNTTESRMKFLCEYLGDYQHHGFHNCDNTGEKKVSVAASPEWVEKLQHFQENYFPELDVAGARSNMINGVAGAYYGTSNVGAAIHRAKYEGEGDFPEFLVQMTARAFRKRLGAEHFDFAIYVPATRSGMLVRNFAEKLTRMFGIPLSHGLQKTRATDQQKVFENSVLKRENVKDAFTYDHPTDLEGKHILLIDDIFDSGATIKEIGRTLTKFGATKIAPIVIARTVGGDLV